MFVEPRDLPPDDVLAMLGQVDEVAFVAAETTSLVSMRLGFVLVPGLRSALGRSLR